MVCSASLLKWMASHTEGFSQIRSHKVHVLTWRAQKMGSSTSSEGLWLVRIAVLCAQGRVAIEMHSEIMAQSSRVMQCAFLVVQVKICQSPDFVIYMSNNPSSNCCHCLRRLIMLYKGEISLHFDPPSRPSCRTRSPLLWVLIRIFYLATTRFIELLYVRSPF